MKNDYFLKHQTDSTFPKKVLLVIGVILAILSLIITTRPGRLAVFAASVAPATKASPVPVSPRPAAAASPTASASGEKATENLKDRIDRILETRQEKLMELEQAGQRRRIFIGETQRITERTVTIRNRRGSQTFTIGQDVVIAKAGKTATPDDIVVGDWLGVIGFSDKETIQPQIVIIANASLQPTDYDTVMGTIKEITRSQIVVTTPAQEERTFQIVRTTELEGHDGAAIKLADLETETQVIVISEPNGTQNPATVIRSLAGQR